MATSVQVPSSSLSLWGAVAWLSSRSRNDRSSCPTAGELGPNRTKQSSAALMVILVLLQGFGRVDGAGFFTGVAAGLFPGFDISVKKSNIPPPLAPSAISRSRSNGRTSPSVLMALTLINERARVDSAFSFPAAD